MLTQKQQQHQMLRLHAELRLILRRNQHLTEKARELFTDLMEIKDHQETMKWLSQRQYYSEILLMEEYINFHDYLYDNICLDCEAGDGNGGCTLDGICQQQE